MRWVMESQCREQYRAPSCRGVDLSKGAVPHSSANHGRGQRHELVDVCRRDRLSASGKRSISGEQLRVAGSSTSLDRDQGIEQSTQPLRRGTRSVRDCAERRHRGAHPAGNDQVAQFRLRRHVLIDRGVADAERAGDVDDRRLVRTVAPYNLLGRREDPLPREWRVGGRQDQCLATAAAAAMPSNSARISGASVNAPAARFSRK